MHFELFNRLLKLRVKILNINDFPLFPILYHIREPLPLLTCFSIPIFFFRTEKGNIRVQVFRAFRESARTCGWVCFCGRTGFFGFGFFGSSDKLGYKQSSFGGKGGWDILVFHECDLPTRHVEPLLLRLPKELSFVEGKLRVVDEWIIRVVF